MQGKNVVQVGLIFAAFSFLASFGRTMPPGSGVGTHRPAPEFHDWSTRHLIFSNQGLLPDLHLVESDPRAFFSWRTRTSESEGRKSHRPPLRPLRPLRRSQFERDWSIYLGTAGTAPAMYPAKFSFDVTQKPSCANDFIAFPVAAKGSASQPNIVALNNLYSGTAGANGYCNRTASASDTGTAATVLWSYNIQGIAGGGAVPTSPVISYDPNGTTTGLKVAFVESLAGSPAHFHVLAWKSGDGQSATNLQNTLVPKTITTFTSNAPVAGSGTATDLVLGTSTSGSDTLSSPFVDYADDVAYVGNDLGVLYRIKDVFCVATNPDCAATSKPAPSLDTTWGTGGALTVCSGMLTAPVFDSVTFNVYVGCSDGKLYSISKTGTVKSIVVGDGIASKTYGAIVDPPIVDSVNGYVYAVSGSAGGGASGVVVQASMNFSSSIAVPIGAGNQCNLHAPVFNNLYYTSPTTTGALLYVAGVSGTVSQPCSVSSTTSGDIMVYGVSFGTSGVMTSGSPAHSVDLGGGPGAEWAPLLEFYNATTATDWLFVAALQSNQTNIAAGSITSAFPTGSSFSEFVTYGLGPSGMIVDNDASATTYAQAASIYFNAQQENATCSNNSNPSVLTDTGGCAVKLTQAALE